VSLESSFARFFRAIDAPEYSFQHHSQGPDLLRQNCVTHEISHAHQVVGRAGEGEDPIHSQCSAMPYLTQQSNGFQPPKAFFDALPLLLTNGVARLLRGATINGATSTSSEVLRYMWGHPDVAALPHEIRGVEAFVASHGDTLASRKIL
jgi:hypothetical protein